jgi:hypothetical protein
VIGEINDRDDGDGDNDNVKTHGVNQLGDYSGSRRAGKVGDGCPEVILFPCIPEGLISFVSGQQGNQAGIEDVLGEGHGADGDNEPRGKIAAR